MGQKFEEYKKSNIKIFGFSWESKKFWLTLGITLGVLIALVALTLLGVDISWYGVMIGIGFLSALALSQQLFKERDLSSDYREFTKLFHVNGYNGNKSFPSGHTNAGTTILVLALIIPRFTDKKWVKYLVTVLCFTYILCLQVARIMASAHYASDVLCGFVVSFTTLCVTYKIMKRKGIINVAGNKC